MRTCLMIPMVLALAVTGAPGAGDQDANAPKLYVPYKDIAAIIDPADKAVLMERAAFEKLLVAAEANVRAADTVEVAQVTDAAYRAAIQGDELALTGTLTVVSMSDKPVTVPLNFAQIGLTRVTMDGKPAPLGYHRSGQLVLIVAGRGPHKLTVAGSAVLKELRGGGMQFGLTLPSAAAGRMDLTAPGDLEIHATVPVSPAKYDRAADRTGVQLTLGGHGSLSVVLRGNGRQEDERAILLGTAATTVQLTRSYQVLDCLYTVQVLRRGVRELTFLLPAAWTVTDVTCPALVKWSVAGPVRQNAPQRLTVRLRTARRGTKALHIQATAPRAAGKLWRSPFVKLAGADFEHGYLLVDTGTELAVRGERLASARRQDLSRAAAVPGLLAAARGRMFYHWSDAWSVRLDLADVRLRTSSEARQHLTVTPEEISLKGQFEITAIGRELFDLAFELPAGDGQWMLRSVKLNGKTSGFEYRVDEAAGRRTLAIELARPVRPERVARVEIVLRRVPGGWDWPAGAAPREVDLAWIRARADTVSGRIAVAPTGDLEVAPVAAHEALRPVTVGRMASLGLAANVQLAYTYERPAAGSIRVRVSRRAHRLAADSIALVTARATKLLGHWRITYHVTRAHARTLYLLADKSLGPAIKITASGPLAAKNIVPPGPKTVALSAPLAAAYDLWKLTLDSPAIGDVAVEVRYDRPMPGGEVAVPLVRPIGPPEMQTSEMLALEASEELAVSPVVVGAAAVDAVDLPPLPARAKRLLAAFRLEAASTTDGARARLRLATQVHEKYAIPAALAADAALTTYLGPRAGQRTEAVFRVANAGMQFLVVRLDEAAELWSVEVGSAPAKPKRNARGDYLVALPRATEPLRVKVVYFCPAAAGRLDRVALGGIALPGVKVNRLTWRVVPPPGYRVTRQFTDLAAANLHRPDPAAQWLFDGLRDLFAVSTAAMQVFEGRALLRGKQAIRTVEDIGVEEYGAAEGEKRPAGLEAPAPDRKPHGAKGPRPTPPAAKTAPAKPTEKPVVAPVLVGRGLVARGRHTLPVALVATPGAGPAAEFSSLGLGELVVGLSGRTDMLTWEALGFAAVLLAGLLYLRAGACVRGALVVAVLAAATLLAIWWPGVAHFANGAFKAALCLIPLYLLIALLRWAWRKIRGEAPAPSARAAAAAALLLALAAAPLAAQAAERAKAKPSTLPPAVVPYEGDPTQADRSDKVLIPYRRYVRLWNRAHPDRRIELPAGPVQVSLAGVRYAATVEGERMRVVLTARVKTFGAGWATLPMPVGGLAVTEATLAGKPARLQVGPKGMVLALPGGVDGALQVTALTTPKTLGRRGEVKLSLPPLPAAVMTVSLPAADLVLEAPGVDGALSSRKLPAGVEWTVPLGLRRAVQLRWSPRVGDGAADRTLSAAVAHKVYAFHWAMVGLSKIVYRFSAGENDRFGLLLPAGATLTALTGANLRDFRAVGDRTVDGVAYRVIEVRLHRPAAKQYELNARWVGTVPELDKPSRLALPRAAGVGRESGTVSLHAAAGMVVKVTDVAGGRRRSTARRKAQGGAEATTEVAQYYWPYQPFALTVQLSRHVARPKARLDQLVRVNRRRIQLLVQAHLSAERGRLFGASFALPGGYELLSAVGPAVEDHYEQPAAAGRRLHVNFRAGVTETKVALVLLRKDAELGRLPVPTVTVLDADGQVVPEQTGRLAVQLAASLEAQTAASENLRAISPALARDWLGKAQVQAVRFAYRYEKPAFSLALNVKPKPTRVRVETFAGLTVMPTAAWYSYRLRYRIEGTPIDEVGFTLPAKYDGLVAVSSPALRGVSKAPAADDKERTAWTVSLVTEVTGTLDVTVNFAVPIDAGTRRLVVPRLSTPAPEGLRAIVAVQNSSRHELSLDADATRRLEPLARTEQADLLPEPVRRNLRFVMHCFTDDWSLALKLKPAKRAVRVQAVVDLMALTTVVDRRGRCRYEVRLSLQNRSEQFLRVQLPKGLELWSAIVAGQPAKPATDDRAGADVVLVPLVKTSPGGLPYDVKMYLAGKAGEPIGWVAKLSPPAIRILGMDAKHTTWSLRLPAGYRYLRPGGNLSPVAGAVESEVLAIDARLDQLKRFQRSYGELVSTGSVRGQDIARANWKRFNKLVSDEIRQAKQAVEANRAALGEKGYRRLNVKLGGQSSSQYGYNVGWEKSQRVQQDVFDNNINTILNKEARNAGVAELSRNFTLEAMPHFVQQAAEYQKANISGELKTPVKIAGTSRLTAAGTKNGKDTSGALELGGQGILVVHRDGDEQAQVAQVLEKLEVEQKRQHAKRRKELHEQLEELADNRLVRYFGEAGKLAQTQQRLSQQQRVTVTAGGQVVTGPQQSAQPGLGLVINGGFVPGVGGRRGGQAGGGGRLAGPGRIAAEGTVATDLPTDPMSGFRLAEARGETGLAVARGTLSLPIRLPAGGTQWDFQGPSAVPSVTIWAVDERLVDGACGTAMVIVGLMIVWLLSRLWRQLWRSGEPAPRGFVPAYVVLAALLIALIGVLGGIVLAAVIICPIELVHRLLIRRAPAGA